MNEARAELLTALTTDPVGAGDERIRLTRVGAVAVITLTLPARRNVLDLRAWRSLAAVLDQLSSDVRAVVLRGAGQHFSAGADIQAFPTERLARAMFETYDDAIAAALEAIESSPVPVVAMVDGVAVGGGCEIAAACDVRVASARSTWGLPLGQLGVLLGQAEAKILERLLGVDNLRYLVLSGELVSAEQARQMSLVQLVCPTEELAERTADLLDVICMAAEHTIRGLRVVLDAGAEEATRSRRFREIAAEAYSGDDLRQRVDAFLSRRA